MEVISALDTVKSLGAEGKMQREWEEFVIVSAQTSARVKFLSGLGIHFSVLVQQLVTILTVIVGVHLIADNTLTVGGADRLYHPDRARHGAPWHGGRPSQPRASIAVRPQNHRCDHGPARGPAAGGPLAVASGPGGGDRISQSHLPLSRDRGHGAARRQLSPSRR